MTNPCGKLAVCKSLGGSLEVDLGQKPPLSPLHCNSTGHLERTCSAVDCGRFWADSPEMVTTAAPTSWVKLKWGTRPPGWTYISRSPGGCSMPCTRSRRSKCHTPGGFLCPRTRSRLKIQRWSAVKTVHCNELDMSFISSWWTCPCLFYWRWSSTKSSSAAPDQKWWDQRCSPVVHRTAPGRCGSSASPQPWPSPDSGLTQIIQRKNNMHIISWWISNM